MIDPPPQRIPLSSLRSEEGAKELAASPDMGPYVRYVEAVITNKGVDDAMEAVAQLPLEKRYVWRVASALKWAFADLDDMSVAVDRDSLSQQQGEKVMELLRLRPVQFCIFMKALIGDENMESMMMTAIQEAKKIK